MVSLSIAVDMFPQTFQRNVVAVWEMVYWCYQDITLWQLVIYATAGMVVFPKMNEFEDKRVGIWKGHNVSYLNDGLATTLDIVEGGTSHTCLSSGGGGSPDGQPGGWSVGGRERFMQDNTLNSQWLECRDKKSSTQAQSLHNYLLSVPVIFCPQCHISDIKFTEMAPYELTLCGV